jgi:CHC2 zinc finger
MLIRLPHSLPLPLLDACDVKARADFFAIASRYMRLRRSGRQFVGLCPFHSERHPSFYVHPEKKIFYCFGCGAGGDLFDFVMRVENCDFLAGLRIVAEFSFGGSPRERAPEGRERFRAGVGAAPGPAKQGGVHRWANAPRPFALAGSWPSLDCAAEATAEAERGEGVFFTCTQRISPQQKDATGCGLSRSEAAR